MTCRIPSVAVLANRCLVVGALVLFGAVACFTAPKVGASKRYHYHCPGERVVRVRNSSGIHADLFVWRPGVRTTALDYLGSVPPVTTQEFTIADSVLVGTHDPNAQSGERASAPPATAMQYEYFCR